MRQDLAPEGYIYFVESFPLLFKIEHAHNPRKRMASIATSMPEPKQSCHVRRLIGVMIGTQRQELDLHKSLKKYLIKNEWYRDSEEFRSHLTSFILIDGDDFYGSGYIGTGNDFVMIESKPSFVEDANYLIRTGRSIFDLRNELCEGVSI